MARNVWWRISCGHGEERKLNLGGDNRAGSRERVGDLEDVENLLKAVAEIAGLDIDSELAVEIGASDDVAIGVEHVDLERLVVGARADVEGLEAGRAEELSIQREGLDGLAEVIEA